MADQVFYRKGNIEITTTLARFGGVTYPINGIGSVLILRPNRTGAIVVAVIAAVGAWAFYSNGEPGWGLGAVVLAGLAALTAYNKTYKLVLRTASGDQQATENRSFAVLQEIKSGIEQAVIARG